MTSCFKAGLAWAIAFSAAISAATLSLFTFGPKIETAQFPVIGNVQAMLIQMDSDREILHLGAYGTKSRQCEFKAITAMVYKNNQWHQGKVFFTDPRTNKAPQVALPISRPVGTQSLGEIFVFPAGDRVQVYLYHDCHPLWPTMTFLYELDFNKQPMQVR